MDIIRMTSDYMLCARQQWFRIHVAAQMSSRFCVFVSVRDIPNVRQEIIVSFLISRENYRGVRIGKKGTNCSIIFPKNGHWIEPAPLIGRFS